jgi:hypothetical protein
MKPQTLHAQEDRLLDFAYGELPSPEARMVEAHLQGCVRCTQALDDIRGVRATMSQLSQEPAPDAGLESLMAYAQQAARRAAAGPEPKPSRWRRWLLPVVGVASVATFGILSIRAMEPGMMKPNLSAAAQEKAPMRKDAEYAQAPAEVAPAGMALPAAPEPQQQPQAELLDAAPGQAQAKLEAEPQRAPDWNNAGSGGALNPRVTRASESKGKWAPPSKKSKAYAMKSAPADKAERDEELLAAAEARKQEAPARERLRLGGTSAPSRDDAALEPAEEASGEAVANSLPPAAVGSVMAGPAASVATRAPRTSTAKEAESMDMDAYAPSAPASAPPPPPQVQAAPMPKPVAKTSPAELSREAHEAYRANNRAREASLLRMALASGASGNERLDLLNRLCEAELALGRRADGLAACLKVVEEAPDSRAAQAARKRLARESVELEAPEKSAAPAK